MKQIRYWTAVVLSVIMTLAIASVPAMAGRIDLSKNAITVTNVSAGATYSLYKMLDLSVNDEQTAYAYTVNSDWEDFFNDGGAGAEYVNIDAQGYVTWKEGKDDAASMEAFGKAADQYASEHNLKPISSIVAGNIETGIVFGNLDSGYYLITSTIGTKTIVVTTPATPNVTVSEKNTGPTLDKQVKEDSTDDWGTTNDANISQVVEYRIVATLPAGSENVVIHDQMQAGLTLNVDSIKVYTDESMNTELPAEGHYILKTSELDDSCTFEISFTQAYLDSLTTNTTLYVYYTATVNRNAIVALPGNPNDSWLDYGDENHTHSTPKSETITYTWDVDVLKYANGKVSDVLEGAQFVLLNSAKDKVATVVDGKLTGWVAVPAANADGSITWPDNTVLTTNAQGKIEIDGLDADTYYLREIKAPDGYNKIKDDIEVNITGATKGDNDTLIYETLLVKVNNNSGTELPETGGMGTTLFYTVGGALVLGAVVLLVTRKRMSDKS